MHVAAEFDEEIEAEIQEDEEFQTLPTFVFEELPEPTVQMSIYGMVQKDLHADE